MLFLSYFGISLIMWFVQRDIATARDLAKNKYFELTLKNKNSSEGINIFINASMNAKDVKVDNNLVKHLSIADPNLRHKFLA